MTPKPISLPPKRLNLSGWALVALSCLTFGLFLVCILVRTANPTDGTRLAPGFIGAWQPDGVLIVPINGEGDQPARFQIGDKVIAVDGVPMTTIAEGLFTGGAVPPLAYGQQRDYTVVRDGRTLTVVVEPHIYPLATLLAESWGALVSTLALIFIAGVAFAQRPNHPLVQALVLMSLAGWGVVAYSIGLNLADMYDPPRFWLWLTVIVMGILLYVIALLRIALVLAPPPTALFRVMNRPIGVFLTVLVPMGIAFLYLFVSLAGAENVLTWLGLWIPTFALASGLVILVAGVFLVLSYRGNRDEVTRRKIRLVVTGGLVSAFIILIANAIPVLVFGQPLLDVNVISLSALPVTVAMGIAIFRYRLVDVDFVVSRTLVYAALTVAMLAIYFMALLVLVAVLGPGANGVSQIVGVLAIFITLGLGIVLFNPLRDRFQLVVDRRFYRSRYIARQMFTQFAVTVRNQVDADQLKTDLIAVIEDAMQPAQTSILEGTEDRPLDLAADPRLSALAMRADVIDLNELDHSSSLNDLRAEGVRLIVPLLSQGTLIGLIKLGNRRNGQDYSLDDRRLLSMLATQVASPLHTALLARAQQLAAVERGRIDQELSIARRIQQALLPASTPELPGYALRAFYEPARAVGGDLFGFIELPGGRIGIFIGDVSDKGVPAAMVMTAARAVLRSQSQSHDSPGKILQFANETLCSDIPTGMFVTCFYAVLEAKTGRLRYANAGQDLPYLVSSDGVTELKARGMPLGLLPDRDYEEHESVLPPGDKLLFYSDGLVEAHNSERVMFGADRLRQSLQVHASRADLMDHVLKDVHAFVGPAWVQEDDITMVMVCRDQD